MAKVQEIGPYSAYAIAVKYGYKGTEEEWVKEQEANRKAAEASASAAAESAKQAAASAEQTAGAAANVDDAKNSAVKAVKNEGTVQQSAVASAGTSAVQNVKNQEAQSTSAVQSAGTTYLEQIKSAGAAQVQAVKDEGAAQTSALDDAAAAHKIELDSIASHPPQPNTETGKWQVWNAETGAYQDTDALYQGGYYTPAVSNDGVLTWQGSQAGMPSLPSANIKGPKGDKGDPGLGVPATTTSDAGKVPTVKADGSAYELAGPYAPLSAAIRPTASGNPVSITDSVEWPLLGLKVYGKSVQDGTPSPENPIPITNAGASGSIETTITGKNLLTGRLYYGHYQDGNGFIENENAVSLPYAPAKETMGVCYTVPAKKGKTYTFSVTNPNANARLFFALYKTFEDTSNYKKAISKTEGMPSVSITPSEDGILVCLIAGSWTDGTTTIHECTASELLQLEVGSTATAYEAPHSQSIVAVTPNGLPGIPVDSGGNYTDASGHQSACDVKDYGTGKYTQMVGHIESYNGEDITTPYMSTTGQLSTGAEVYYVLDEPVVMDISADELTAYRTLHTYDGATVVSTTKNVVGLEVKYLADGEKYVERIVSQKAPEAAAAHTMALLADGIREGVNGV